MLDEWKDSENLILNKLVSKISEVKKQNNEKTSNQEIEKALDFIDS